MQLLDNVQMDDWYEEYQESEGVDDTRRGRSPLDRYWLSCRGDGALMRLDHSTFALPDWDLKQQQLLVCTAIAVYQQ